MNVINNDKKFLYLFVLLLLISIGMGVHLQKIADDLYFIHILETSTFHEFITSRYLTWSGRVVLDALTVGTINFPPSWRFGIPASISIICLSISRMVTGRFDIHTFVTCLFLFLSIPKSILDNAAWWITGYYNYLLPVAAMFYSLSIFIKQEQARSAEKTVSLACLLLSCFNEQTAMLTLSVCAALISTSHRMRCFYSYAYLLMAGICTSILLFSPGNYIRFEKESWRWMPGFQTEGILNKVILGADRMHEAVVMSDGMVFFILSLLCLLLIRKNRPNGIMPSLFSCVLFFHILMIICLKIHLVSPGNSFYNSEYLNPTRGISVSRYLSYFISLMALIAVFYALAISSVLDSRFIKPLFSLIMGCATVFMMGFSPTVYASGMRVLFLWEVISMTVCIWIFYLSFGQDKKLLKFVSYSSMLMCLISFSF